MRLQKWLAAALAVTVFVAANPVFAQGRHSGSSRSGPGHSGHSRSGQRHSGQHGSGYSHSGKSHYSGSHHGHSKHGGSHYTHSYGYSYYGYPYPAHYNYGYSYYGYPGYGYPAFGYSYYGNDWAVALGVTGAVIGTAIIADAVTRPARTVYVAPEPAYYPPAPASASSPSDAYSRGYQAGLQESSSYEAGRRQALRGGANYGTGGRSDDQPYYGR